MQPYTSMYSFIFDSAEHHYSPSTESLHVGSWHINSTIWLESHRVSACPMFRTADEIMIILSMSIVSIGHDLKSFESTNATKEQSAFTHRGTVRNAKRLLTVCIVLNYNITRKTNTYTAIANGLQFTFSSKTKANIIRWKSRLLITRTASMITLSGTRWQALISCCRTGLVWKFNYLGCFKN